MRSSSMPFSKHLVRLQAFLAAVLLSAGALAQVISTPGLPDEGVLRLQLGATDQLLWETPSTSDVNPTEALSDRRDWTNQSQDKCFLQVGSLGAAPSLLSFAAGVPSTNRPGFAYDAIGVYGGGNSATARGVACSRAGSNETLTLSLTGLLAGRKVYRTVLDVEVKQNARIRAIARVGSQSTVWELRSGNSIVSGEGSSIPGSPIVNCNADSDSGSDSGPNDNCRWEFAGLWSSLELQTLSGEWSLEGGADFGTDSYANNSLFFLTQADGVLDCGDATVTAGDGITSALVSGFRLANASGSTCTPIPYSLESTGNLVEFLKNLLGQLDAAFVFEITFLPELAPAPTDPPPATYHDFGSGQVLLNRCVGTPVYDSSGNLTELIPPIGGFPDLSSESGTQYACYFHQTETYPDEDTIQITQSIYLLGDWAAIRY